MRFFYKNRFKHIVFSPPPKGWPKFVSEYKSEKIVVLLWNCPECGYEAIPALGAVCQSGSHCPNPACGYRKTTHRDNYEVASIDQIDPTVRDPKLLGLIASGKIGRDLVVHDQDLLAQLEDQGVDWKCKVCEAVHPDEGIEDSLLYCPNCGTWQISENDPTPPSRCERDQIVLDLTGSELADGEYLDKAVVPASLVKSKRNFGQDVSNYQADASGVYRDTGKTLEDSVVSASSMQTSFSMPFLPWRKIMAIGGIALGIATVASGAIWLLAPRNVTVTITDMPWSITREIQELRPTQGSDWEGNVPSDAYNRLSKTMQRGTRQVPDGFETYYTTERYQSGTKTESYSVSEQYQSGTKTESYSVSEQYQSGTKDNCTTTNRGNGTASRSCTTVPVYSTRSVPKTRTVPVYATREVPKTRTVPVYATREVPNQRQKYRTEPVFDTRVDYTVNRWLHQQTLQTRGVDDQPRVPPMVELDNSPYPEKLTTPSEECKIYGTYPWDKEIRNVNKTVPCSYFSLVNIGDKVQMRVNQIGIGELRIKAAD